MTLQRIVAAGGYALVAACLWLQSACAPVATTLADDPLLDPVAVCATYAGALNVLAAAEVEGSLPEAVAVQVDGIVAVVDPLCLAETPPADNSAALARLLTGVRDLVLLLPQEG